MTKEQANLENECMLDSKELKLLEKDFEDARITDKSKQKDLTKRCAEVGVTTINPYELLKIVDFYKKGEVYERKRFSSLLRTWATVMSLLALEAGLAFFSNYQDARDTRNYIQSINSQLEQTKRNDLEVYKLMNSGKYEEATNIIEEQIKAYQGRK